jgi:hypothetical protein
MKRHRADESTQDRLAHPGGAGFSAVAGVNIRSTGSITCALGTTHGLPITGHNRMPYRQMRPNASNKSRDATAFMWTNPTGLGTRVESGQHPIIFRVARNWTKARPVSPARAPAHASPTNNLRIIMASADSPPPADPRPPGTSAPAPAPRSAARALSRAAPTRAASARA